jgi:hypothetical protein
VDQQDVLAIEVAERLGVDLLQVMNAAGALYGHTVTKEHRKRVGDAEPSDGRSSAIRRGNHTRAISNEIARHLAEGPK